MKLKKIKNITIFSTLLLVISISMYYYSNHYIPSKYEVCFDDTLLDEVFLGTPSKSKVTFFDCEVFKAERGDTDSQWELTLKFHKDKNMEKAFYWALKHYENNGDGEHILGILYYMGAGVKQDKEKGLHLLRKAASYKQQYALMFLEHIQENPEKAERYFWRYVSGKSNSPFYY